MITLLGKYHAYAPPFKYVPALGGDAYVGGVEGRVPWTEEIQKSLREAWDEEHEKMVTKEFKIPSAHRLGVIYTVRKMIHGWTCTCPARGSCWHIKTAKQLDFDDNCDVLDGVQRSNDYDNPL